MATADGVISRFKRPEYTGENRCLPCTVVNAVIAALVGLIVAAAGAVAVSPAVGVGVGVATVGAGLAVIYLRGYLVPGTPSLTRRYFPAWLLALFGKEPVLERHQPIGDAGEIDPESALLRIGALEECQDGEELCLTEPFREAWRAELEALDPESGRDRLLWLLDVDVDESDVSYKEFGSAFRARVDGTPVGKWESEAAFLSDLGAAKVFAEHHPDWHELPVESRGQLLNAVRLFADTCPSCGGEPSFGAETVRSCCSSYEVAVVTCDDCEARLFETPVDR